MSKFPFLMVVYACYEPDEILLDSISVLLADLDQTQIVLVNNGTSSSLDFIRNKYSDVVTVQNEKNLGFGWAMNIGVELALARRSRYVLLMNQDLTFETNALSCLIAAALESSEFGVFSPVCHDRSGENLDEKFSIYLSQAFSEANALSVVPVPFVNAAAWLLDVTVLDVGGFDPLFFMYGEDEDLAGRIRASGREIGVVLSAQARHAREHASSSSRRAAVKRSSEMLLSIKRSQRPFFLSVMRELYGSFRIAMGRVADQNISPHIVLWSIGFLISRLHWFWKKNRCHLGGHIMASSQQQ